MKKIQILIALMALSFAAWGQAERVKTVETPDSASLVVFDTTGNNVAGTNVQDAIEESNPTYNNHVFLSATGGNNATGRLGDPHRAFADPWGAQDSLSSETNLSFLAYQGDYAYTGPYSASNTNRINIIDTTRYNCFPGGDFSMSGVTGGFQPYFLSDVSNASTSPSKVYFNGPNSNMEITGTPSVLLPIGFWNKNSEADIKLNRLTSGSGRAWGIHIACKRFHAEIDSLNVTGGIALAIYGLNPINPENINIIRDYGVKINSVYTTDISDVLGAIRYQGTTAPTNHLSDSLSTINVEIGSISTNTSPILAISNYLSRTINSKFSYTIKKSERRSVGTNGHIVLLNGEPAGTRALDNCSLNINFDDITDPQRILCVACNGTNSLVATNKSNITINIKNATSTANITQFDLNTIVLRDSSTMVINCENCVFEANTTQPVFDIRGCNIEPGSQLIIKGRYFAPNLAGDAVFIRNDNVDISGLTFENATFINDGVSEWMRGETSNKTITGVSGLWSNSGSTINVTLQGNELWGFNYPKTDAYYDLQTILDSIFISIPKQSATLYQATLRQYIFPTPATVDTIVIDTLSNALMTTDITQDTGYIRNISSDTVRWQVSYNLFRDSDEDPLTTFIDLTTDGTDDPEAIEGSRAYSEQTVAQGVQHAGQTFTVDVPPGDAIRLCTYGSGVAAGVAVSDLTISVTEIYRE